MVGIKVSGWLVARIIIVSGGGSSRDLSRAFWAGRVRVWAWSSRASLDLD